MRRILTPIALLLALGLPLLHAEGPNDPAPFITARGTVNGKKVLFDNSHGETAGAADWVIDGGFSDFANALADNGFYVKELRKASPITLADLTGYDVLVFGESNFPFKTTEQAALLQYVQNGGAIFFIADHYNADRNKNRWDGSECFNGYRRGAWTDPAKGMSAAEAGSAAMQGVASSDWLATNFGVRFRYNALGDLIASDIVPPAQAFNITTGVATVAMHAGGTVAIVDPTKAKGIVYLPTTTAKWANAVDQGVYNGGGRPEGPYVAVAKVSFGKAAFIGDSSPVEDATPKYLKEETGGAKTTYAGFQEQNDATLLVNIVKWLATQETYTSLNQVAGLQLDTATSLLAIEDPASSTEPQAEPWATPSAGYKWYDPSTFKPGSYGYGSTLPTNTVTASISTPAANVTLASGATQSFVGSATDSSATATLTYGWTFGDGASAATASASHVYTNTGTANVTYTATFTATDNTGAVGTANRTITVTPMVVTPTAPSITSQPASQTVTAGVTATFSVTASGTAPFTYQWSKNGTAITGATAASYTTPATATTDNGATFTVVVSNAAGSATSTTATLTVNPVTSGTFFEVEANNTLATANGVNSIYNTIRGNLTVATDADYFALTLAPGQKVTLNMTGPTGPDWDLNLKNAAGAVLTSSTATGTTESVTYTNAGTTAQTVYPQVFVYSGTSTTPYTLALTYSAPVTGSTFTEGFETGTKTSYTTGDVTFASGIWTLNDAMLGNSASDPKTGTQSVRIRNSGKLSMKYNWATGAKTVSVKHAVFGTDASTTWSLWYSTNSGTTWTQTGSPVTTSSSTLSTATFAVNVTGPIRFEIRKTDGSTRRTNFDDFTVVGY